MRAEKPRGDWGGSNSCARLDKAAMLRNYIANDFDLKQVFLTGSCCVLLKIALDFKMHSFLGVCSFEFQSMFNEKVLFSYGVYMFTK